MSRLMLTRLRSASLGLITLCAPLLVHGQCGNNNTLYNVPATPPCPGSTTVACVFGGEYVLVNVVAGNTYTFSTCGGAGWDTEMTLYNNAGGALVGFNDDGCGVQSTITWTATFTGTVRVLLDEFGFLIDCNSNSTCAALTVTCTPPPSGDCVYSLNLFDSFADGWGTSYVGVSINGGPFQNYTVTGATNQVLLGVNIGDVVVLNYNNSGAFQGDNSYSLTLGGGALFNSGSPPAAGISYTSTVTCQPPPAPPEDCIGSITICNNQSFNNNTNNTGNVADLTLTSAGCLGALERQGTWYNFSPSAGGTIGFTINPANPLDDYDFAIWGPFPPGSTPNSICPPLGAPIRCSFAAPPGQTGLNYTATDFSEDPLGDKWVQYMTVTTGQVYLLYISNYSQSGLAFSLGWDLGGGASLDCTILPMDLLDLQAHPHGAGVDVTWTTVGGSQIDHYVVERSGDGVDYLGIGGLNAIGSSVQPADYRFVDTAPGTGINYYRIQQVDMTGYRMASRPVAVLFGSTTAAPVLIPNPVNESASVFLNWPAEGLCTLTITDAGGREVHRSSHALAVGDQRIELSLPDLEQGAYLLRLFAPDGSPQGQTRFVKLR